MAASSDVKGAKFDRTDPFGTYRPDLPPAQDRGFNFQPLTMTAREPIIQDLPDTQLGIFQQFVPEFLVEKWAAATNEAAEAAMTDESLSETARVQDWTPTSAAEIYVFVAMVICMENHPEPAITRYWQSSVDDDTVPFYPFTRHMTLRRFQLLFRRIRIFHEVEIFSQLTSKDAIPKAYLQVDEWSNYIQEQMQKVYVPGTTVAVDECMQGFTGKSALKTYIPNKPTPEGIKIWVVAQDGIFLRWLWHTPGKGPIGIEKQRMNDDSIYHLTPTQLVVVSLLKSLPNASYHVFLDNLFSSPDLFKFLYDMGIGASGTARLNCGMHERLVQEKKKPDNSNPWGWSIEVPTPCNKVINHHFTAALLISYL